MIKKSVNTRLVEGVFEGEIDGQESRRPGHTSRRASSFSFCASSYTYTGLTSVPGAGLVSSLVVLVIAAQEREMDTMKT